MTPFEHLASLAYKLLILFYDIELNLPNLHEVGRKILK
jgi:hypothetical protein